MTMTELITAASVVLTATAAALQVNSAAASALAAAEQRLQALDRLDAELVLVERQLRDLATSVPLAAAATDPAGACATKADALRDQLAAQPASSGLVRRVERRAGPGSLLAVELRSEAANLTRQRLFSLAALGLCEADHAPL
ncbi:MAG: hypothetical protein ACKN89_11615 [Cyanobium sp.]|jgi:hypothetical protein